MEHVSKYFSCVFHIFLVLKLTSVQICHSRRCEVNLEPLIVFWRLVLHCLHAVEHSSLNLSFPYHLSH